jgi:DNA-binding transcriptional LysR family regulator
MARRANWETQIGRRLRLRDLHAFCAVVEQGSMAKAAVELGISQPAVSDVVANLEHGLGVRLFDRGPQGVEPTIFGQALVKCSLAAFDELKQGVRDIEFLSDPTTGELRLGCVETISTTLLPQIILRFSKQYPRVVVHVDDWTAPAVELPQLGLRDRKYDLVMVRLVRPYLENHLPDDLKVDCVFNDQLVIATGSHNRWARRRKIDLAELVDEPWIFARPGTWNYNAVVEAFKERGLDVPKASLVSVSVGLRTRLLANGPFIAALPNSILQLNRERYALKALPVGLPDRPWPVVIMTLKHRTLSPVVQRFIECAREVIKSLIVSPCDRNR